MNSDETDIPTASKKATAKKTQRKKGRRKSNKRSRAPKKATNATRREARQFPASSFEEALQFAQSAFDYGSGKAVRRLSLFDHLGKSPESGPSRQLITNANKYGLIKGGYQAEQLELTPDGVKAVSEDTTSRERVRARIKLGIEDIEPFAKLYERFVGNKLPARNAMVDAIQEFGVSEGQAEEAVDTFIVNARFLGLLQTLSGAERIVTIDHLLDSLPATPRSGSATVTRPSTTSAALITAAQAQYETTCFYVAPIGDEGSEHRRHSDLILGSSNRRWSNSP
jgi:hypothetical protein